MNDSSPRPGDRIAVLGLGNVLLGDDGFGPYVIALLQAGYEFPENVVVEDLGTPGLDLTPFVTDVDAIIMVDTVKAEGLPGEMRLYRREELNLQLNHRLSPHDPGLAEALALAELDGGGPRSFLLVGVIPEQTDTGSGLSPAVEAALGSVEAAVLRGLAELEISPVRRDPPLEPNIWWLRAPAGDLS
jgi:hydrogenase maturation protease